jgi:hypothetical protein
MSGLILYVIVGDFFAYVGGEGLGGPHHVLPGSFQLPMGSGDVSALAWSYVGHIVCSTVAGGGVAAGWHKVATLAWGDSYPSAWNALVGTYRKGRWVVVHLSNGEAYAGILDTAKENVGKKGRDILLREPARFENRSGEFVATRSQYKFLPADLIQSVDVLSAASDERLTSPGETVFVPAVPQGENNASCEPQSNSPARSTSQAKGNSQAQDSGHAGTLSRPGRPGGVMREVNQVEDSHLKNNHFEGFRLEGIRLEDIDLN